MDYIKEYVEVENSDIQKLGIPKSIPEIHDTKFWPEELLFHTAYKVLKIDKTLLDPALEIPPITEG